MPQVKYYIRKTRRGTCEVCGATFYSNKVTAAYCGNKCRQEAYRRRKVVREDAAKLQMELFPE